MHLDTAHPDRNESAVVRTPKEPSTLFEGLPKGNGVAMQTGQIQYSSQEKRV